MSNSSYPEEQLPDPGKVMRKLVHFNDDFMLHIEPTVQLLEECQSELYDLKFKQDGKHNAISDEVEILLTGDKLQI